MRFSSLIVFAHIVATVCVIFISNFNIYYCRTMISMAHLKTQVTANSYSNPNLSINPVYQMYMQN